MQFRLVVDGDSRQVEVDKDSKGISIRLDGAQYRARAKPSSASEFVVRIGRRAYRIRFDGLSVLVDDQRHTVSIVDIEGGEAARSVEGTTRGAKATEVRPPMPGRVIRILAPAGTHVTRGQILLVLEAMKMQNEIPSPRDGVVREVRVAEGESITADRVVVVLEAD